MVGVELDLKVRSIYGWIAFLATLILGIILYLIVNDVLERFGITSLLIMLILILPIVFLLGYRTSAPSQKVLRLRK